LYKRLKFIDFKKLRGKDHFFWMIFLGRPKMAEYINDVRDHAKKTEYYYQHCGRGEYALALTHFDDIVKLMSRAMKSKKYKNELSDIARIRASMQLKIDEMKLRKYPEGDPKCQF
jgi:hypothetical protein